MRVSIADYLKLCFETAISKALQQFITEYTKKDPHLTGDPDAFIKEVKDIIEPLLGHGLSGDKYDQIMSTLNEKLAVKPMVKYITNFLLAGAGMRVLEALDKPKVIKFIHELIDVSNTMQSIKFEAQKIIDKLKSEYAITDEDMACGLVHHVVR